MATGHYATPVRSLRIVRLLLLLWLDLWRFGIRLTLISLRLRGAAEV